MAQWYRQALAKVLNKEVDWNSDTITMTLHTATYTPNLDTHAYVSDLTNELANGSGYTTGGITLGSCTIIYTAANSWGTSRANSTAYVVGDVVRPASGNGFLYRCAVAGTSAGTTTTLGTVLGRESTDGTAVWENVGSGAIMLDAADGVWSSPFSAGPFRYAAISDRTPERPRLSHWLGWSTSGRTRLAAAARSTSTSTRRACS